jgi:pimeloyl-ACP methyl ester carboxylesterase
VVLVHGLWFSHWALIPLARRLAGHGYRPLRYAWDTTGRGFEESAEQLSACVAALGEPRVHFVAHSLGGLLVRALLHAHPQVPPGRVVTLGSPHGGSRTGRVASRLRPLRPIVGRAVEQLVAGVPGTWRPPAREVGVLAGTRGVGLGRLFPGLERPNDGVVAVSEARLAGAADFRALEVSHTGLLFSRRVARLTAGFLERGAFPG